MPDSPAIPFAVPSLSYSPSLIGRRWWREKTSNGIKIKAMNLIPGTFSLAGGRRIFVCGENAKRERRRFTSQGDVLYNITLRESQNSIEVEKRFSIIYFTCLETTNLSLRKLTNTSVHTCFILLQKATSFPLAIDRSHRKKI